MALSSLNTNIAAYYAQSNMSRASNAASASIARLSSGNRLVRAADDVAAMSAGTTLRTNVTTLRRALLNASQASSLLQVADGGLAQITDILQRQKALSVQASGGTLSNAERGFLNQEFQNLTQEIDRIAGNTNFNGVKLLNGALADAVQAQSNDSISDRGTATITFSQNIVSGRQLRLNYADVIAGTHFAVGATLQDSLDNMVNYLNTTDNLLLSQATYSRQGNSLAITAKMAGSIGEKFIIKNDLTESNMLSSNGNPTGTRIGIVNGQYNNNIVNHIANITVSSTTVSATTAAPTAGRLTVGNLLGSGNAWTPVTLATLAAGDSLETVVNKINANRNTTGVSARIEGFAGNYTLQFDRNYNHATETLAELVIFGPALTTLPPAYMTGNKPNSISLIGGTDRGIGAGDSIAVGNVGNSILTGQNQRAAKVTFVFPEIADSDLLLSTNFGGSTSQISLSDGWSLYVNFGFVNKEPQTATEVKIGSTLTETLDNLVSTINNYQNSGAHGHIFNQIEARREGNNVVIERRDVGPADADVSIINNPASQLGNLNWTTGKDVGGVNVSGLANADFHGKISGFTASYSGVNDALDVSVTVGGHTYTGKVLDSTPSANRTIRFNGGDGGYFDVELAAGNGMSVNSQADANVFSQRINEAVSTLTFYQNRQLSNYSGTGSIVTNGQVSGSLIGTSMKLKTDDFSDLTIDKVQVTAPQGANKSGSISITINGDEYRTASNLGADLGKNGVFKLTSASDPNSVIEFRTGDSAIDFSTAAKAASFEAALKQAFGMKEGSASIKFQVGNTTSDMLDVSIGNVDTRTIFKGINIDVTTQNNALAASDAIDAALRAVTSVRAEVGAKQSRFDYASANIQSSIQSQDAARANLMDTDVAAEATIYAMAQVQLQAGISVLAQANKLPNYMLKLLEI